MSSRLSIYSPAYLATTVGILVAVVACAFDQTAVAAVMPAIVEDLGGTAGYSLTFVVPLAAGIFGMVAAGLLTDMRGARASFMLSAGVLSAGLIAAMVAPNMALFVLARGFQGLGIGGIFVAIYAVIGQLYPARLTPSVFTAFAGAYVLPSLVGPAVAGVITRTISWHAVFGLVLVTLLVAVGLLVRAFKALPTPTGSAERHPARSLALALVVSVAAMAMNLASQLPPMWRIPAFGVSLVLVFVGILPLIPRGTLKAADGIPRLIASRGLLDMFFTTEFYLPLLLATAYGLGPTLTGMGLSAAGVTWFIGSSLQSRFFPTMRTFKIMRIAVVLCLVGVLMAVATAACALHWLWAVTGWGIAALGLGFVYPRVGAEVMERSAPEETGFTGSALQVMATVGNATMMSIAGLVQVFGMTHFPNFVFTAIFAMCALVAVPLLVIWRTPNPRGGRGGGRDGGARPVGAPAAGRPSLA